MALRIFTTFKGLTYLLVVKDKTHYTFTNSIDSLYTIVSGKTVNFNVTVTAIKISNTHTFLTTKKRLFEKPVNKIKATIIGQ